MSPPPREPPWGDRRVPTGATRKIDRSSAVGLRRIPKLDVAGSNPVGRSPQGVTGHLPRDPVPVPAFSTMPPTEVIKRSLTNRTASTREDAGGHGASGRRAWGKCDALVVSITRRPQSSLREIRANVRGARRCAPHMRQAGGSHPQSERLRDLEPDLRPGHRPAGVVMRLTMASLLIIRRATRTDFATFPETRRASSAKCSRPPCGRPRYQRGRGARGLRPVPAPGCHRVGSRPGRAQCVLCRCQGAPRRSRRGLTRRNPPRMRVAPRAPSTPLGGRPWR
jgi:hypothetical protein